MADNIITSTSSSTVNFGSWVGWSGSSETNMEVQELRWQGAIEQTYHHTNGQQKR